MSDAYAWTRVMNPWQVPIVVSNRNCFHLIFFPIFKTWFFFFKRGSKPQICLLNLSQDFHFEHCKNAQ